MQHIRLKVARWWLAVLWLACAGWASVQAGLPSWVVQATYVLPGGDEGGTTVRWRFEVQEESADSGGLWWKVLVRDADGRSPVEATFLLEPRRGQIAAVQVREFFQAGWHEYPLQQEEPASRYFQTFGPLPLDFIGRDGLKMDGIQNFRLSAAQRLEGRSVIRREYAIRSEPSPVLPETLQEAGLGKIAQGPFLILRVEDSFSPGSSRRMTWDSRLPWWVEYRCPAYTARLVEWKGGTGR